ncbi:Fibrocystin-L [Chionoecetes opilio]|uniref:Fibrocystin-L n=1 Tax=Chionoecetes opilio TaxID=41210 RepID=A0A8J5CQP9_CHIOP|nr:Fibrocystin-L [Chionoecetes opilio]
MTRCQDKSRLSHTTWETHTLEDGTSITLAGEVALLSRNVVVEGNTYETCCRQFGGRIVVSKRTVGDVEYVGSAQLDGVELRNMGQEGFTDLDDPRYSLAYVGLGTLDTDSSYVKRSSFNLNYNVALGLLGTSGMQVEDNVVYYALDSGVRDESGSNTYKNNLITTVLFAGTYLDRKEEENYNFNGAFQLDNAPNTVLSGNVVAGAEQAGFKTFGEPCKDETQWTNNEVHSTIYGVMVVSVDNRLGVNQIIYSPGSRSHVAHPKTANTTNSLFVGASPSHTCAFQESKSEILKFYSGKFFSGGVDGGNAGLLFGSFTSGANMAPKMGFSKAGTYPALYGSTHIESVTFSNYENSNLFRLWDILLLPLAPTLKTSEDCIPPVW